MNKEMRDLALWSIETATAAGANDCRVGISGERFVEISYRNRKPENIKEASRKGLVIETYVEGRYSSQGTSDLRKIALQDFISSAVAATRLLAEDPYRTLPDPKYYEGRATTDLQVLDPDYNNLTSEERHSLVRTVEESCLANGGPNVVSVTAMEYDSRKESVVLTSNGFAGERGSTSYSAGAEMTVNDEDDRRPNGYHYVSAVNREDMPAAEQIGAKAAERTLDLLGGKKLKTETLPMILENRNVSRLLSGLLGAMSGRSIQQKQSFIADHKDRPIAADRMVLVDDPLVPRGLGSRLYDSDGFATKKRTMIDSGILREFYLDWYYSRKLGWDPTTGGSSNLTIPPGTRSVKEIMKDLGRGMLVTGFIGGSSNSTTGDMSIGIIGRLFDRGEPTAAAAEMNIADNHLKLWHKLVEAANDPWIYSSQRMPSLVFEDIVFSGA